MADGRVVVGPDGCVAVVAGVEDVGGEFLEAGGCAGEEGADEVCEGGGREGGCWVGERWVR